MKKCDPSGCEFFPANQNGQTQNGDHEWSAEYGSGIGEDGRQRVHVTGFPEAQVSDPVEIMAERVWNLLEDELLDPIPASIPLMTEFGT